MRYPSPPAVLLAIVAVAMMPSSGYPMNQIARWLQSESALQVAARRLTPEQLEDEKTGGLGIRCGAGGFRFNHQPQGNP